MESMLHGLVALNPHQARTAAALFERMFPADEHGPGATEIRAVAYLYFASKQLCGKRFTNSGLGQQDMLIERLERGELPHFPTPPQQTFFGMLRENLQEGLFADPGYGGNHDLQGWERT